MIRFTKTPTGKTPWLVAPSEFWDASEEDKSIICNGIGAKDGISSKMPQTIWGLDISDCGDIHDWGYYYGKTIENKDKHDRLFLNNMLRKIEYFQGLTFLRWLRRMRAIKYYSAVKDCGGPAFWANKN